MVGSSASRRESGMLMKTAGSYASTGPFAGLLFSGCGAFAIELTFPSGACRHPENPRAANKPRTAKLDPILNGVQNLNVCFPNNLKFVISPLIHKQNGSFIAQC